MAIDIRSLGPDKLEPAFELATRGFIRGSTLHRALGIGLTEYQAYLRRSFKAMIDEGLSVAAMNSDNGELSGCLIVTDFHRQLFSEPGTDPNFAPLAALTEKLCRKFRRRGDLLAGEAVLVDMGVVSPDARGEGVYQRMRIAAHELARKRGFRRVLGELSSSATQHFVLNRLAHKKVAEVVFADFEFEGAHPFRTIEDPPSLILAEGEL